MTTGYLTLQQQEEASGQLASWLAEELDLTFLARDLGFPDGTAIHKAAKPIIAARLARLMVKWRDEIARVTAFPQDAR